MRRGRAVGLALLLATLPQALPVHARRPKSFSLNWVRAPSAEACIASHELARIIEGSLGPLFVLPADAEFSIEGSVSARADAPGFEARIVVSDRQGSILGQRVLQSDASSCRAIDPQVVLVIAMAIDPEIALDGLPPQLLAQISSEGDPAADLLQELRAEARAKAARAPGEPNTRLASTEPAAPSAAPHPQPRPTHPPAASESPGDSAAPRVVVSARLALGAELLPNLGVAPGVALQLRIAGPLSFEAASLFWLENDARLETPTAQGDAVHFNMALVALLLCVDAWRAPPWRWNGCAGAAGGARWTDAEALTRPDDVTRFDGGPALSTELALTVAGPWTLACGAALHAPLLRETFTYGTPNGDRVLFVPGVLGGWSWLALGAEF